MISSLNFKKDKGLHYVHGNIRSLFNKFSQLKQYLLDSNISCIGLSETWLSENIPSSMLYIPGFQLIRLDRKWVNQHGQTKKGGGVCCYIDINLNISVYDLEKLNYSCQDGEILHVIIDEPHIKKCILINVYRPPQGNVENFTNKIIDNITYINNNYPNAEIIMLGDFNLNVCDKNSEDSRNVRWIEQATGLKQFINGITRYSQRNSCIDLIFTNMTNNFSTDILDVNISDHQFIHINRKHYTKPKAKLNFLGRSYKNYDKAVFCDRLIQLDWNNLLACDDVNRAWNIMLSNITTTIDSMCPLKHYRVAQAKEPWVTNEILEMIKDKDRLLRRAKNRNTVLDWILAKQARNNTNLQRAKATFVQENLEQNQNNSKKFWQNINEILPNTKNKHSSKISLKDHNKKYISDDKEMANTMNNYFTTIGPSLASNMNDPWVYSGPTLLYSLHDNFNV